jgi:uncharacterized protein YcfJ
LGTLTNDVGLGAKKTAPDPKKPDVTQETTDTITTLTDVQWGSLDEKFEILRKKMVEAGANSAGNLRNLDSAKAFALPSNKGSNLGKSLGMLKTITIAVDNEIKTAALTNYNGLLDELANKMQDKSYVNAYAGSDGAIANATASRVAFDSGNYALAESGMDKVEADMNQYKTYGAVDKFKTTKELLKNIRLALDHTATVVAANDALEAVKKEITSLNPVSASYSRVQKSAWALAQVVPVSTAKNHLDSIKDQCDSAANVINNRASESQKAEKTKMIGTAVGAVAGGVGGYFLTAEITKSAQKANAEGAQKQWLDEVGKHIRCYIGADEVGEFGDIVSTSLE